VEERIVFGGTANLSAPDFGKGLREVLEALEEQVVLMRLLGESAEPSALTVRIGAETGLTGTSVVTPYTVPTGTRWRARRARADADGLPVAMGAVRTVARYVGRILGES